MLILIASIVVFFSKEVGQGIKKFFSIPGTILLAPLFVMSWLTMYFQREIWRFAWDVHSQIQSFINWLASMLPIWPIKAIIAIILLTMVSVLPVIIVEKLYWRRYLTAFDYGYQISTFIWIIGAILLIMKPDIHFS